MWTVMKAEDEPRGQGLKSGGSGRRMSKEEEGGRGGCGAGERAGVRQDAGSGEGWMRLGRTGMVVGKAGTASGA